MRTPSSTLTRMGVRACVLAAVLALPAGPLFGESALRSQMLSADAAEAYEAIFKAGEAKDPAAAADLFDAGFLSPHPHIAVAAGEAMAALGPDAAKQADLQKTLARALKSKDAAGLMNLARILGAWGDPSVDEPLASLASVRREPDVTAEALYMAGSLKPAKGRPFAKTIAAVDAAFKDKAESAQRAACSAASRLKDPTFVEPLLRLARSSQSETVGLFAVWALSRMKWRGGLGPFLHVLTEGNPKDETRNACVKAITDLAGPADIPDLLSLSRNSKKDYRDAACIAIGRLAAEGELKALNPAPKEGEKFPSLRAVIDRLIAIVDTEADWEVRDAASRALIRIGEPARVAACENFPQFVDAAENDLALTAIELCGVFKADGAYRALHKTVQFERDPTRRMFAARALGLVNPQLASEELLTGIRKDKKGKDTTYNLVQALGYVRHETAYLGLVEMFTSPDYSEEMLYEAETALERLTGHRFGRKPVRWNAWYEKAKGGNPFHPHVGKYDRGRNRRETVAKRLYGLSDTTERAVESGLRWLEIQQHREGCWDGNEKGFGGVIGCEPAYTGLILLSFLGAGYNAREGRYRETIRRATEWLAATQFYDGGFPVTGGGDSSWIFAYLIGMAVWGINESYGLSGDEVLRGPAQRGIDYLVRVQTPGGGWRYGARYKQSDTSCTSWVLMTLKTADLLGLEVAQKALDGIDSWLERCAFDITGQEEVPEDLATDYDKEVGVKRIFKAFTGYLALSGSEGSALQMTSMTAVGMACRFFSGWKRSHPFLIGSANYLMDNLPQWKAGLTKGMAIAWYFYYWYYGTLAMHQMGGRYWRAWNEKIKTMLPENQRRDPPALAGSWDPDTAVLNGGRLFSTPMAIMTLETYYRFSPLMIEPEDAGKKPGAGGPPPGEAPGGTKETPKDGKDGGK